jgi:hypothetical protein
MLLDYGFYENSRYSSGMYRFGYLKTRVVRIGPPTDAHGPLVNAEVRPNAVARSMAVVKTNVPQKFTSEGVKSIPLNFVWKDCSCEADLAFKHPCKGLFFKGLGGSKVNSPKNIRLFNRLSFKKYNDQNHCVFVYVTL